MLLTDQVESGFRRKVDRHKAAIRPFDATRMQAHLHRDEFTTDRRRPHRCIAGLSPARAGHARCSEVKTIDPNRRCFCAGVMVEVDHAGRDDMVSPAHPAGRNRRWRVGTGPGRDVDALDVWPDPGRRRIDDGESLWPFQVIRDVLSIEDSPGEVGEGERCIGRDRDTCDPARTLRGTACADRGPILVRRAVDSPRQGRRCHTEIIGDLHLAGDDASTRRLQGRTGRSSD